MNNHLPRLSRRQFLKDTAIALPALVLSAGGLSGQMAGQRPAPPVLDAKSMVEVLLPRARVPVALIIDDSTCLVNLNRFAMPQFDVAFGGANKTYQRNWREWPVEIPDAFVRKFGEWCASEGVKGKYSVVPYPACVGRLDQSLPGWTAQQLKQSIDLVRTLMMPNWDIHPEMVTHSRVIDLKTGQPYEDTSLKFMENWEWTTGRSVDEIASYMAYALQILKNVGLPCEGVTTPGGFGNKALPQLSQASLQSLRSVFKAEIPHYFRHLYDRGSESVAPRVEYASGLDGPDPKCVVSVVGCTGDWTGGWDNTTPVGPDAFITSDLAGGRMVDVIQRGEPALMLAHWTGIYWNGQELGFQVFKEVVRRLTQRFDHLIWMKLSEVSRYWAARELTGVERKGNRVRLRAPFSCPSWTMRVAVGPVKPVVVETGKGEVTLREVRSRLQLRPGTWCREDGHTLACWDLAKGQTQMTF